MYIDSINSQGENYAISSFQETLINTQPANEVKTIVFPNGYTLEDSNLSFNIMFENGHMCSDGETPMTLNGKPIQVYSYSNNELINLRMILVINKIWTLKPKTLLELYYDGNQFIVVGNPIIYTTDDCDYYANGKIEYKTSIVTTQNQTNLAYNVLLQGNQIGSGNNYCVNTASGNNTLTFNPSLGVLSATTFKGALNGTASCATNADNASKFENKTYAEVKSDIQSGRVTMSSIATGTCPLALCTGTNTVGISTKCQLTFNVTEGALSATKFCGSFCGTADNACKFNGKDYTTAYNDIRSNLVTISDSTCSSAIPIALCTDTNSVGKSNCCPFTYIPTTGTLCVNDIYNVRSGSFLSNLMCLEVCNLNPSGSPILVCRTTSALGLVTYEWRGCICNRCMHEYFYNDPITSRFVKNETVHAIGRFIDCMGHVYDVDCFYRDNASDFLIHGTCITNSNTAVCARISVSNAPLVSAKFTIPYYMGRL